MYFSCLRNFNISKRIVFFYMILGLCSYIPKSALADSNYSCLKNYSYVVNGYFSGQSDVREINNFFHCVDDFIQRFLKYTRSHSQQYYTFLEISRFMQYMGFQKNEAEKISRAVFYVKAGLVGGHSGRLSRIEINNFRQVLMQLEDRLQRMRGSVLVLMKVLNHQFIHRRTLLNATETIKSNLKGLGESLSQYRFAARWDRLLDIPDNFQALGFSFNLNYWKPSIRLIRQWNKMFYSPYKHTINTSKWPVLMGSMSEFIGVWFYYKRFIEKQNWSQLHIVQHVQYLMSRILDMTAEAQRNAYTDTIFLSDIDQLMKHAWMLPSYKSSVFSLASRSVFCFLLSRYAGDQSCSYNIELNKDSMNIAFRDKAFSFSQNVPMTVSQVNPSSDRITRKHIAVLRKYLDFWISSENFLRKKLILPSIFGLPNRWLNRSVGITADQRLLFHRRGQEGNKRFLSYLNWQAHLVFFMTSAYKENEGSLTPTAWEKIAKEWTPLILSLMPDIRWQSLHQDSQQIFQHGDFLLAHSNGDQLLQNEELLELFSIFLSASKTAFTSKKLLSGCKVDKDYFNKVCAKDVLVHLPQTIFKGFPYLRAELLQQNYSVKVEYLSLWLDSLNANEEVFSIKDLFGLFLKVHYQENMMEHLDKDFNQVVDVEELDPLLNTFENALIEKVPVVYTTRDAMAFISYLFYYGKVPVFSDQHIHLPMHFNRWLFHPEEWSGVKTRRTHLFNVLAHIEQQL